MQWSLKWGSELKTLLEIEKATGVRPTGLQEKPDLRPDCKGYYDAFSVLSGRRTYNQAGMQPLAVSEVAAYLTELGISGGEGRRRFLHLILEMDSTYMDDIFKRQEKASKS